MTFPITRLSASALALSLACVAGAALAQNAPAPAPAAPAAPAAGAQPGAPAQQQQIPSKVDLVSPEAQWVKICGKEQTTGRDACQTMRDFAASADQAPIISLQVFELQGEEKKKLRFMMQPIGMLLKPGFRIVVDKTEPIDGKYDMCFPNACTAEVDISQSTLSNLKKGQNLAVVMRIPGGEPSGRELTFNIPLKDFGPTFDGKPTDPKLLEQQKQALQQQLQKKAEEQRKMLEQQQQQGGAAAPAAPAAAPAAPKQ